MRLARDIQKCQICKNKIYILFLYVYTYTTRLYVCCVDVSPHITILILLILLRHGGMLRNYPPPSLDRPRSTEERKAGEKKMNTTAKYDTPIQVFPCSLDLCICVCVGLSVCLCLCLCLCLFVYVYISVYI
jgi:hypothetical protein